MIGMLAVSGALASCTFSEFMNADETLITIEVWDISDITVGIGDNKDEVVEGWIYSKSSPNPY